jgi:2-polyprenyl-6-hydroxyphenyl methylase / 3-demethylubiquinone-9 3-methyltransferase
LEWWSDDDDNTNVLLRYSINPIRFGYFMKKIRERTAESGTGKKVLDLGCAGGFLTEEFAKAGFKVTGLDPSNHLLKIAAGHAQKNGLEIEYRQGFGEALPFESGAFDYVACCDVLEHVDDLAKVIAEISRVLNPGGIFFFDTVNRNLLSLLFIIKVAQDWKFTAWEQPRTHDWKMFVKPEELKALAGQNGLSIQEFRGISPTGNMIDLFLNVRARAKGLITRREMGRRFKMAESDETDVSYMGYAEKQGA